MQGERGARDLSHHRHHVSAPRTTEVATGAERLARSREHDHTHGLVAFGLHQGIADRVGQLDVDGVLSVGAIEGEGEHALGRACVFECGHGA